MNRVLVFGGGDLVPGQNCLSDENLALLASSKTADTNPMLDHVAGCDWCGERLRLLVEVSQTKLTQEEELVLSRVAALRPPRESRRARPAWRWLAPFAAAAAVSVAVAFLWNARTGGPERAGSMLAQAYGQNRVIELRVSDAVYGPLRKERGAGSPLDKPAALLNAEARIREALEKNPEDVDWLRLKGRAQLLEQEPDEAVKTLTLANSKDPRDVRVLADLGIAYAERSATTTAGADDPARAIEFLERAKQVAPKNLDVIFNLALVYERQNMFSMASLCWKEYLGLDSQSPWADEARVHLKNLESKRAGVQLRRNLPRTPQAFLAQLDSGAEAYPEVVLEDLFTDWKGKPDEGRALDRLAQLLVSKHRDRWFLEALRQPEAFRLLGEAVLAGADGNFELAHEKAAAAESLYTVNHNLAGRLIAQFQKAYTWQRVANGPECLRSFDPNALDSIRDPYPWLYGQLELQLAACSNLVVHVGAALAASERALDALRRAQYHSSELRAASLVANYRGHLGDVRSLYRNSLHALGTWWDGPYDGVLAQNLLLNLSIDSETSGHRFAAWAYRKEALIEFQPDAPAPLLALATSSLASSALWIDKVEEARNGYREADRLFALAPDSTAKRSYIANADKIRAQALAASQPSTAVKILEGGPPMSFPFEEMRRAEMLGTLNSSLDRHKESEDAYARAVELAEKRALEPNAGRRRAELLGESELAYKGLVAALLRNHNDWTKSFEVWERFRSGVIETGPTRPDPAETFLVFAVLPGGVAVWVDDATALHGAWLTALDSEHQTLIDTFARECSRDTPDPHWRITSQHLDDWLIAPVAQWLKGATTVVIEADGALNRIPFAALVDAKGIPLGERFTLVSSPNVSSYQTRTAGARVISASEPTLVLADPELRGDMRRAYPSLSEAEAEAANIQQRFPNTRIFRKKDATVDVLESYGVKSSLVHFAGHGIGNARNGGLLLSAIGEGQADILDTSRVEKQNWKRSQLVTLASCSAASEDSSQGNSTTLVRAFLAAGARRVMAARWNVDSAATADLMQGFYDALARGDAPSVALHNAASVIRRGRPHPYYWAAFEMFGYK